MREKFEDRLSFWQVVIPTLVHSMADVSNLKAFDQNLILKFVFELSRCKTPTSPFTLKKSTFRNSVNKRGKKGRVMRTTKKDQQGAATRLTSQRQLTRAGAQWREVASWHNVFGSVCCSCFASCFVKFTAAEVRPVARQYLSVPAESDRLVEIFWNHQIRQLSVKSWSKNTDGYLHTHVLAG